ncbi:DUF6142 family protein [Mediterraneibacter agrestimuris]|uniref:DUF6142 family protein n=1 Tax=Mediterraneibacter agrestimuris TaxID=2941333 RepID=UPI0020412FC2|nr:DUF6142 family protein [Mediterraneibacter agrestimuris]
MFRGKNGDRKGREKALKKQTTGKYGNTKIKHSGMGMVSCWTALLSLTMITGSILIAYVMRGKTISVVGGLGIISIVMAGSGLRVAVKGFRDRNRNYITCRIGVVLNSVILLGLIIIFFRGVFK